MKYEVRMIDTIMWGIWNTETNTWYTVNDEIIHSPSSAFLENSYLLNLAANA